MHGNLEIGYKQFAIKKGKFVHVKESSHPIPPRSLQTLLVQILAKTTHQIWQGFIVLPRECVSNLREFYQLIPELRKFTLRK